MAKTFTLELPHLLQNGPICQIVLKLSDPTVGELRLEKQQIPSIAVQALIDTGASTTAISQRIVDHLRLVPRGTAKVYTSNQSSEIRNAFDVSLEFDTDAYIPLLRVLNANLQDHSIDCLIGRDVLQYGRLFYDGPKKQITLSF